MVMKYATTVRSAQNTAIVTALGANATLKFYTGTMPATPATAVTGTLLATCLFATPTAGTDTNGVLTFGAITGDTQIDATGVVGYARAATSAAVGVVDFLVTATGGGGDITTPSTSWVATEPLAVTALTITAGNA